MPRPFILVVFLPLFAISAGTSAATIHVEKWGRKLLGACGSKTNPCGTMVRAMSQPEYKKNAKIRVGPGIYPLSFAINQEGVKLESIAGPRATVLRSSNVNSNAITITAEKVRIGKRGKGFSVTGASVAPRVGIRVESPRSRIEGNVIYGNFYGIQFIGMKQLARFNEIRDNVSAGIDCSGCNRAQIRDNTFLANGSNGLIVSSSDSPLVQGNLFRANGAGMWFSTTASNVRVRHNVVDHGTSLGLYVNNSDGAKVESNISSQNTGAGYTFINGPEDKPAKIKKNIAMGQPTQSGFSVTTAENVRFEGNSAIQNGVHGLTAILNAAFSAFNGNNFYSNGQFGVNNDCGIHNNSGINISLGKTFLGSPFGSNPPTPDGVANDNDDHDTLCVQSGGYSSPPNTFQSKPFPYKVNRAAKL